MIENYKFKFRSRGKIIYVPNERCERKGRRIIQFFARRLDFPDYFYHYKSGGHVAALHAHLVNEFFFRVDIQNFYYSIARMRVTRALRSWRYPGANTIAKWSCVANPLPGPWHVLPIGFVQSPLLASLVLLKSPVARAIERAIASGVHVSVYLDDLIGSHDEVAVLEAAYNEIRESCVAAELIPNPAKLLPPRRAITAFNCDLRRGAVEVTDARVEKFFSTPKSAEAIAAFQAYRNRVASRNLQQP